MKMTREEVVINHRQLEEAVNLNGRELTYAVTKNTRALKEELQDIQVALNKARKDALNDADDKNLKEYEKVRQGVCDLYADKDSKGDPMHFPNGDYKITEQENIKKVETAIEELQEKYGDALEKFYQLNTQNQEYMKKESDVNIYTIKLKDVPEGISKVDMNKIFFMIEA